MGEALLSVPEACSSCDERGKQNRPVAAQFAASRLARNRRKKEGAIPIDDPHFDPTPAQGAMADQLEMGQAQTVPRRRAAPAACESSDE